MSTQQTTAEKPEINILAKIHNGTAHVVFSAEGGVFATLAGKTDDKSKWGKVANVQEHAAFVRNPRSRHGFRVLIKNPRGQWHDYPTFEAFSASKENWKCAGTRQAKYHPPVSSVMA